MAAALLNPGVFRCGMLRGQAPRCTCRRFAEAGLCVTIYRWCRCFLSVTHVLQLVLINSAGNTREIGVEHSVTFGLLICNVTMV